MQKWSEAEKLFFLAAAISLAASVYFVTQDLGSDSVVSLDATQRSVGTVRRHKGDVRRRKDEDIKYSVVSLDMPVFNRDSVFTGEESMAEISLATGANLKLSESSMIVIAIDENNENDLALKLGSFLAKLKPQQGFRIEGKSSVRSTGGWARFEKTNDGTRITVLKGDLEVVGSDGSKRIVHENQSIAVAESGEADDIATSVSGQSSPESDAMLEKPDAPKVFEDIPSNRSELPLLSRGEVKRVSQTRRPAQEIDAITKVDEIVPEPTPIRPPETPLVSTQPKDDADYYWIWVGVGGGFLRYHQSLPGYKDISFANLTGPALVLRGGSMVSERFGLDFSYKEARGEVKSSDTVNVRNGEFKWRHASAEALMKIGEGVWAGSGRSDDLFLQAGVQSHIVPFLVPLSSSEREARENYMMLATVGAKYRIWRQQRLRYEILVRYQYPFETGSTGNDHFAIMPQFAFDGSVGQVFQLGGNSYIGLYWYGQWHKYQFNFSTDSPGQAMTGEQELFYSNIDLRFGFEF